LETHDLSDSKLCTVTVQFKNKSFEIRHLSPPCMMLTDLHPQCDYHSFFAQSSKADQSVNFNRK